MKDLDLFFQAVAQVHFYGFSIVMALDAGPELYGSTEITGQTQGCIGADAAFASADFIDPHGRYADVPGKPVLAYAHWLQEFFQKDFAGMCWRKITHTVTSLMIIGYFNIMGTVFLPRKTDSPLSVDADAVLSFAVITQEFKPIGRRYAKIIQGRRMMQENQLSFRKTLDILGQFLGETTGKYFFGLFTPERLDHEESITLKDGIVKG